MPDISDIKKTGEKFKFCKNTQDELLPMHRQNGGDIIYFSWRDFLSNARE